MIKYQLSIFQVILLTLALNGGLTETVDAQSSPKTVTRLVWQDDQEKGSGAKLAI